MTGNKLLYLGAILSVALSTVTALLSPLVIQITIDSIIGNKPIEASQWIKDLFELLGGKSILMQRLWLCSLALVLISLINGLFQFLRGKWSAQASESIARNIRDKVYNHLQNLPYDYHVKAETGDLIQRCTSDVETIRRFLGVQLVEMGRTIFMVSTALTIMLSLDVRMTLISMAVVPVIFVFAFVFFQKVQKAFLLSDEAEGRLSTVLQENLTGIRVVRAFGRQAYEVDKFDEKNVEFRDLTYRLIRLLAWYWALSDFLVGMQIGTVLVFGVYWASMGTISLGTLVVFMTYEGMLLWPIRQMGRILTDMGKTFVSVGRIQEILDQETEDLEPSGEQPSLDGDIEFKNVYFEYEKGRPVLQDLSFKVKRGQTVAILGPTGSGKSTMMHLLQRLYDYQKGSITINGIELKEIDKKWLRKNIGIVLQEPFLFSRTIKENIGIAKPDVTDEEIFEAANIAALHDVIKEFEKGYDTVVGERGVTLSGGQKQRVAIARTLIKDSKILIFDDSLSAVDTETDAAIRKALRERSRNITTFIISHRITTLSEADLILVLEHGRLVQSGTHKELIKRPGLYQRIWNLQNALEEEFNAEAVI